MQYLTVAEAYRDLEQASGRLALVDRLADAAGRRRRPDCCRWCVTCARG